MSVAGLRPGFGLGGMTHSLLVMLRGFADDGELSDVIAVVADDVLIGSGLPPPAPGRIAICGAVTEHEDAVVADRDAADAGVDGTLGGFRLAAVIDAGGDKSKEAAASRSDETTKLPLRAAVTAVAILMSPAEPVWGEGDCCRVLRFAGAGKTQKTVFVSHRRRKPSRVGGAPDVMRQWQRWRFENDDVWPSSELPVTRLRVVVFTARWDERKQTTRLTQEIR